MVRHRIPPARLAELASGAGTTSSLRLLRAGQLSRHLLLLRHVADTAPVAARCADALEVLDSARARDPETAARVLTDPMVGAWLAHAVRRLHSGSQPPADVGRLAVLAAVVAAACDLDADLTTVHPARTVMIPAMGGLVGAGDADRPLVLRARGGVLSVNGTRVPPAPDVPAVRWQGLRTLTSGPASVTLEDVDPCRAIYRDPAEGRANDDESALWQERFAGAWRLISRCSADRTAEIGHVLRTIVPLRADANGIPRSATSRHAFGALGTTMPKSAAAMAVTMVHETQHSILNAILQLEPLFESDDDSLYFAPWRADPRPLWGLCHGVFAFLAVAETMERLRAEPGQEYAAEKEFATLREQLRPALNSLLGAPSLTDPGRIFAASLHQRLAGLESIPVSRTAAESAVRALNRTRAQWRERNSRAD